MMIVIRAFKRPTKMNMLTNCILTNYKLNTPIEINEKEFVIKYSTDLIGKIKIEKETLAKFMQEGKSYSILAGICRNNYESDIDPPLINENYLSNILKNASYPKSFKEKCWHLLKYMHSNGGNEYKKFKFSGGKDYPLCYAEDKEQFDGIMKCILEHSWVEYKIITDSGGSFHYMEVVLKTKGIDEVEKKLPTMPLVGLVSQKISTGDDETDKKINHAKDLFFIEPPTRENMRSACEALIYILEPIREELKNYFNNKDVQTFFTIVNTFDIRHNKEQTKRIEHSEQFEWLFYSLLNTINTYSKLKTRLGD